MTAEGRCLSSIGAVGLAVFLTAPTHSIAAAQSFVGSPRVSVMDGHQFALSIGLRGEAGFGRLALFGQGGVFAVSSICLTIMPPVCSTPSSSGIEFLGGVRLSLPPAGVVHPAISLGTGAMVWDDYEPYHSEVGTIWEAEISLGLGFFSWSDLLLGATLKSVGQSVTGGMRLGGDRGTYAGITVGLLIPGR